MIEKNKMERINIQDLWEKEFENAYRFFNSKGNIKTRSILKDKWYKSFKGMLIRVETAVKENLTNEALN